MLPDGIHPIFVLLYFIIHHFLSKFSSILRLTLKQFIVLSLQKQSSSPTSVATVSISTSAVTTTTDMDRHVTPENPFGVIGEVASAVTALQSKKVTKLSFFHFQGI